jgi:hypothetical protein
MDFGALPTYPASAHIESPDRSFALQRDLWQQAATAISIAIVASAASFVGMVMLVLVWLTARPVDAFLGLSVPDLIVLLLAASCPAWVLFLALVRRSHSDAAGDYDDRVPFVALKAAPR